MILWIVARFAQTVYTLARREGRQSRYSRAEELEYIIFRAMRHLESCYGIAYFAVGSSVKFIVSRATSHHGCFAYSESTEMMPVGLNRDYLAL